MRIEESIKVIPLSGKSAEYSTWAVKFMARAKRRGYKSLLKGDETVPTKDELDDSNVTEAVLNAGEANELAFDDFIL